MSWVFHLKKGVTFHNGEPFNAETVKLHGSRTLQDTENAYMTEAIASVEVVDDHTVKFVMARPEPNLLYNLVLDLHGRGGAEVLCRDGRQLRRDRGLWHRPVQAGKLHIGQETVLVRNDDYTWGPPLAANAGPAKVERLTFREIPEDSTAFLELKTGGVDLLLSVPADLMGESKEPTWPS
jgi:peptide/nickel transport system substrate-binding protein